ncbi:hypothetical protein D9M71_263960 [compost metagenome]
MPLLLHIVVVAVHRLKLGFEGLGDHLPRGADHGMHHQGTVLPGEILGPADGLDIVGEMPAAFLEIGQVAVGQVGDVLAHVGLGQFDEQRADGVADPTRATVQHEPDAVGFIQAHFDEVVAGAQGAEVLAVVGFFQARVLVGDGFEAVCQYLPRVVRSSRHLVPGADVTAAAFHCPAVGHGLFDGAAQAAEVVRQIRGGQ